MESSIAQDFSGSIFGYIPYLSLVRIDGGRFAGRKYMIAGYTFDPIRNTIRLMLMEVFFLIFDVQEPPPFFTELEYIYVPGDTGEVVQPIIRG